jgi:hypothetical protein
MGERARTRIATWSPLALVGVLQLHRLDDSDTWWHLAAGRLIVGTGSVPATDPFSYTAPGAPWLNRQWLFESCLYGSWRALGPAGPALLAGALFLAAFWALLRISRARLPAWAAALVVSLVALAAVERFTVRPESATFCFLAVYLLLLDGPVGWRRAATIVCLQVLWANMHALSVLGVVPVGAMLFEALVTGRRTEARPLAACLVGVMLAEAATPFGIEGALYPFYLADLISGEQLLSYTIVEHRPTLTALDDLSPVVRASWGTLLGLGVLAIVPAVRQRAWAAIATAAAFAWLGFLARRNVALVGIGVLPLVARGLGPWAWALGARRAWLVRGLTAGVVIAIVVLGGRVVHGGFYRDAKLTRTFGLGTSLLLAPRGAVAFLDRVAPDTRVFNDGMLGGLVMWESPGRHVFFDGRLQVYPDAVYREYRRVLGGPRQFERVAERWDVGAALLHHPSPGRLELAATIARLPEWRVAYVDPGGIVLLRNRNGQSPAGLGAPVLPAWTPGVSGVVERVVAPLRGGWEVATAHYQRGRATHFVFGPPGYAHARADFASALRARPDFRAARVGLAATQPPPSS